MEAIDEFGKQVIPDLKASLPAVNPTWTNLSGPRNQVAGRDLDGTLRIGLLSGGNRDAQSTDIKGLITIEIGCPVDLYAEKIVTAGKNSHAHGVRRPPRRRPRLRRSTGRTIKDSCQTIYPAVKSAGGDATMMHLPDFQQFGNSHMLMQDKNNLQVADLILKWIDEHVENKKSK